LVVLFLATLSVSFMLLLILFQVVFKNIHLQFNTRTPETAPTLTGQPGGFFQGEAPMFQRMGVQSASVQTPGRTGRTATPASETIETSAPLPSPTAETNASQAEAAPPLPTLPPIHSAPSSKSAPLPAPKPLPVKGTTPHKPMGPASPPDSEDFELE
jgi:hypothetical protein